MCGNYGIVLAFRGFGMGFHFIGRLIAKVLTGRWEALPGLSIITGIVSSVVTFLSVKYTIMYLL